MTDEAPTLLAGPHTIRGDNRTVALVMPRVLAASAPAPAKAGTSIVPSLYRFRSIGAREEEKRFGDQADVRAGRTVSCGST